MKHTKFVKLLIYVVTLCKILYKQVLWNAAYILRSIVEFWRKGYGEI